MIRKFAAWFAFGLVLLAAGNSYSATAALKASAIEVDNYITIDGAEATVKLATITALKAYTGSATTVYIESGQGKGTWNYVEDATGGYAALVTADTLSGLYAKHYSYATSAGAWVRDFSGSINVAWFGAVGDWDETGFTGTDDHVAINAATLMGYTIGNPNITFPKAEYLIGKDKITVYSNQTLWLNGSTLRKNERETDNSSLRMIESYDWATSGISNFILRDGIIYGDGEESGGSDSPPASASIGLYHAENCHLFNVESKYSAGDCVAIYGVTDGKNNTLQNVTAGPGWGQNAISIVGGNFGWDNVTVTGEGYTSATGLYIDVENDSTDETSINWMNNVTSPGLMFADLYTEEDGVYSASAYLTNCTIGPSYNALSFSSENKVTTETIHIGGGNLIKGGGAGGKAVYIKNISGIKFHDFDIDTSDGTGTTKYAINILGYVSDLEVRDLRFLDTTSSQYGVFVYDTGNSLENSTFSNCNLLDVYMGGDSCANNIFSNCTIDILVTANDTAIDNIFTNNTVVTTFTNQSTGEYNAQIFKDRRGSITAVYDFSIQGGSIGTGVGRHVLSAGALPDNAVITRSSYAVIEAFTSDGLAVFGLGHGLNLNCIHATAAFDNADYAVGYHDGISDGTAANFALITTADKNIELTVQTADLTGGKIIVWVDYVILE